MVGSKWDEILQELTKSVKKDITNINKSDLISFCVTNNITRNSAENFLKNLTQTPSKKDNILALQKKEEGNILYKNKKYAESVLSYTESIFLAEKNDECLPLSYSNRSMALQQLGCQSECIRDIDMALECGYPVRKRFLLVLRKAKCLVELGNPAKAREILEESLKDGGKDCDIIKKELDKIKNLKNKEQPSYVLPTPVGGENDNFISASKHINVYFDETKGRHVKATADISIGDVLFVEKPYAFVTFNKSCLNCCKSTKAPIPCWYCTDAHYCSTKCRDEFWKSTHLFECGYADLFASVGIAHLSLRVVLKASANIHELKKTIAHCNSKHSLTNGIVCCKSSDYDAVYNLVDNFDKYNIIDLFQYVMTALLLALHLKTHTNYFSSDSKTENLTLLTSVLCRHILQLICNGHAISDVTTKESADLVLSKKEVRIGTAIYPSASMMNHSCEPSIINCFYNNYLIVRARKAIKNGEEVYNCYGPNARRMCRASRQEILSKQYFFECRCSHCSQKYDIQEIFTALKCTSCNGALVDAENDTKICLHCSKIYTISSEIMQECSNFYSLLKKGEVLLGSDASLALKTLIKCWLCGRRILYKFHEDLCLAANMVARCLITLNDYKRCIEFLKCCIRSIEIRFGSFSVELADEMKNLADIITSYALNDKSASTNRVLIAYGVALYQKAEKILSLLSGSQQKELEEITTNMEILQLMTIK